ncbi:MAG: ABC transporter ATP-binding protein [Rikenellaceae bacterium]|nr:ABC transporter ATP-binding protein [Rikenellaceae bacterium]MBR2032628.1 ABC transporter ATP-binding protein [Alistipes sp.]
MIKVSNIEKSFGDLKVLRGVSLEVEKGEIVSIVGASGAGKTTLLQIIGTLLPADGGEVEINGTKLFALNEKRTAEFRNRHIGFVFQFHNLLPEFSALENVMMPALIGGAKRKEAKQRALELLSAVGLSERAEHKPAQLSGGEQQRVAIARALMNKPSVLLADEPTGNLDTHNRDEIQRLLFEVREKFGQTIVMVTHDERLAEMADRKIVMSDGAIL